MFSNRDLSHINNITKLQREIQKAHVEIGVAEKRLEHAFSSLPGRALGGAVSLVAGGIVKGIVEHFDHNEKTSVSEPAAEPATFGDTLKSVGSETAMFALSRLVEKLLAQRQ